MKQPKENKSIKKAARKDLEASITEQLNIITGKFGVQSKKTAKLINATAKKLAKKLAKEVKFFKATVAETLPPLEEAVPVANINPAPAVKVVKKKTAPKTPAKV